MEELVKKMNELLATTFALYLKAQNFHWNVRGKDFSQLHDFFGDFYGEIYGAVDTTAEQIRALGVPAIGALGPYKELSRIADELGVPPASAMIYALYYDNKLVIDVLNEAHALATSNKEYGLINFIEGRIDTHKKHQWMLAASMDVAPVQEEVQEEEQPAQPVLESITEEVKTYILNPKQ